MRAVFLAASLIVAGTAFAAPSNPPAPSASKASAPQQAHSAKADDVGEDLKRPTERSPPIVISNVFSPSEAKVSGQGDSNQGHEESSWKWVWEAIIAVATVVLAGITGGLVAYTKKLWGSTADLVRDARDSADRGQRAYLTIAKVYATWHANEDDRLRPVTVILDIENTGQTPAGHVVSWVNSECSAEMPRAFQPATDAPIDSVGVIGPRQKNHMRITRNLTIDMEDEVKIYRRGDRPLYVWGKIEYDTLGKRRWTTFRFVMPKDGVEATGGRFKPCRDGNEWE